MNKKLIALAVSAAATMFSANASALTVSYNWNGASGAIAHAGATFGAGNTLSTTNWTHTLTLPKFDSTLGTLTSAVLTYTGAFQTSGAIDSEDASNTTINAKVGVDLAFAGDGSNGSTNIGMNPIANPLSVLKSIYSGSILADSDAGAPDFVGTDAITGLNAAHDFLAGQNFNITNLAAVLGASGDTFSVFTDAQGATSTTGSANIAYQVTTTAKADISVVYTYNAPSVPEPTTVALMGLGLAGFAAARRRKQA